MKFMKMFIKCSVSSAMYRQSEYVNHTINMNLVSSFCKCRHSTYPDNRGAPAIKFKVDSNSVYWIFEKEKDRDDEYERILSTVCI